MQRERTTMTSCSPGRCSWSPSAGKNTLSKGSCMNNSDLDGTGLSADNVTENSRLFFSLGNETLRFKELFFFLFLFPVCKFVSIEMKSAFEETGKTKEVIDRNYRFIDSKGAPPIIYVKSDLRFIEVVENVCQRLLEYNLHKERSGSNRFAKGMSETFSTLHGLVNKGVNVVMDIPYELWNETSAEVADLKKQCDVLIEQYEDVIEDWYKGNQEEDLTTYLCEKHVLKGQDTACLDESWTPKRKGDQAAIAEDKKKKKKKKGGKKGKGKGEEGGEGGGDGNSEGEKASKKKKEKKVVKKKKKSKAPVEKTDGGVSSDEEIQPQVPLSGQKTEL